MKNRLLLPFVFIFLFSCTGNDLNPVPESEADLLPQFLVPAPEASRSSDLLKQEVTFYRNTSKIKNVRLFAYDQANRCTSVRIGTIDSLAANPVFRLSQTLTFHYQGPFSWLPSTMASVRTIFPNLTTTYYFRYNSLGRKIMDSVMVKNMAGEPASKVVRYGYHDGQVSAVPSVTGFPIENHAQDTLAHLSGGDTGQLISRHLRASGDRRAVYTLQYDEFRNPYHQLNIANSLYALCSSTGLGYNVPLETHYLGVNTHNMTSWASGTYTVTYQYRYNPDRLPVKQDLYYPGDVTPSQTTYFTY